jgi:predicted AlkP superfamily phosphohydrolase/phosphomutase
MAFGRAQDRNARARRHVWRAALRLWWSGAVLGAALGCAPDAPQRPIAEHASLDAFEAASAPARRKVALLGLDGASWEYLEPLFAEGKLPNLARLAREGARARLRSVECHFTPPAWTSMLTGEDPARHGVYSFGNWNPAELRFEKVTSNDVQAPFIWDVASRFGKRVTVTSVPVTFPAYPVEGVMVSGIMTPKRHVEPLVLEVAPKRELPPTLRPKSHAPLLTAAFENPLNVVFAALYDSTADELQAYDRVRLTVLRNGFGTLEARLLASQDFELDTFSPWVRVRVPGPLAPYDGFVKIRFELREGSKIGYQLSPTFVPLDHPFTYPASLAADLRERFGFYLPHEFLPIHLLPRITADAVEQARHFQTSTDWDLFLYVFGQSDNAHHLVGSGPEALPVYEQLDAYVGEVMDGLDPETTLIVVSDHGFGRADHAVDLNRFLARLGLLVWKREGVIDHERTLVFHNMWHLFFANDRLDAKALDARGIAIQAGETPRQALMRVLTDAAKQIEDADGRAFPVELLPIEAGAVQPAPDMAVRGSDDFWIEFWNVDRPSPAIVRLLPEEARWKHARDGIFVAWGADVRKSADLGVVPITDVGPTILDRLGLPVAADQTGRPIVGLLEGAAATEPLHRVSSYEGLGHDAVAIPEDPASFEETLRALGYVRD